MNNEELYQKLKELYLTPPCCYSETLGTKKLNNKVKLQLIKIIEQLHVWYLENVKGIKKGDPNFNINNFDEKDSPWSTILQSNPPSLKNLRLINNEELTSEQAEALESTYVLNEIKKTLEKFYYHIYFSNNLDKDLVTQTFISLIDNKELERCLSGANIYLTQTLSYILDDPIVSTIRTLLTIKASSVFQSRINSASSLFNDFGVLENQSVHSIQALVNYASEIYGIPKIADTNASLPIFCDELDRLTKSFKKVLDKVDFFSELKSELFSLVKENFFNNITKDNNFKKAKNGIAILDKLGKVRDTFNLYNLYDTNYLYLKENYLSTLETTLSERLLFGNQKFLERSQFPIVKTISLNTLASNPLARSILMTSLSDKHAFIERYFYETNEKKCWDALSFASLLNDLSCVALLSTLIKKRYAYQGDKSVRSELSKEYEEALLRTTQSLKNGKPIGYLTHLEEIITNKLKIRDQEFLNRNQLSEKSDLLLSNKLALTVLIPPILGKRSLLEERAPLSRGADCFAALTLAGRLGDLESVVFLSEFMLEKYKVGTLSSAFLNAYHKTIHFVSRSVNKNSQNKQRVQTLLTEFTTVHKTVLMFLQLTQFYLTSKKKEIFYSIESFNVMDPRVATLKTLSNSLIDMYQHYQQGNIHEALEQFQKQLIAKSKETKQSHKDSGGAAHIAKFFQNNKIASIIASLTQSNLAQALDALIAKIDTMNGVLDQSTNQSITYRK